MQNSVLKFLTIIILALFLSPLLLSGKPSENQNLLTRADSLFQQKRYTQSFEIYNTLFTNKQYTPAMFLKMAYIQEGLNHISQSVYYLNLYHLATRDEAAATKLEELATKYSLEGYAPSEFDRVYSLYTPYREHITYALLSLLVFLMVMGAVQRFRFQSKPYATWTVLFIVSMILLTHLNLGEGRSKAIIMSNNTYLMDGPSAGASVISIVRDGHRVELAGKTDVWLKVKWGEGEAYIKENSVLPINL